MIRITSSSKNLQLSYIISTFWSPRSVFVYYIEQHVFKMLLWAYYIFSNGKKFEYFYFYSRKCLWKWKCRLQMATILSRPQCVKFDFMHMMCVLREWRFMTWNAFHTTGCRPFVRGIYRSPLWFPLQRASNWIMRNFDISLSLAWNCLTNSRVVGDTRPRDAHVTSLLYW